MRGNTYIFLLAFAAVAVLTCGRCSAVLISWGAYCETDFTLRDQNLENLKGAMQDADTIAMCGHGPFDLVYLVWDRDADGTEMFNCARKLDGDIIVDSSFIGTGISCAGCSTGGFADNINWIVTTGTYDTFYVIALNDTTMALATHFGTSAQHNPSVWVVHRDSLTAKIACTASDFWATETPFDEHAVFDGFSIVSGGLSPGDKKVGMERVMASVNSGSVPWTWIKVDNGPSTGCTNDDLDIDSVKIYKEVAVAGFDPDDDLLIGESEWGSGPPAGGSATVTFFSPETLTSSLSTYYIAFDIAPGAAMDHCVAACLQDSSYVGISDFCKDGNFPFCSQDVGLPVEISRFEAFPGDRMVLLEWTTESEVDNRGFYVYRALSADGDFSRLNEQLIPGAGNSYLPVDYEYVDGDVENGKAYFYRLVSVSYGNALSTYDRIVSAIPSIDNWRTGRESGFLRTSPNPFTESTRVTFMVSGLMPRVSIQVYDISGKRVRSLREGLVDPGLHFVKWDGSNDSGEEVPSGLYFCRFENQGFVSVAKIVRVKR
jgi:hypothetical protein